MTERIRWHDEAKNSLAAFTGCVGALDPAMFHIWRPDTHCAEWQLTTRLHGMEQKCHYGGGPDELKAEAERWLEEFVSSLGAVFGTEPVTDDQRWQVGEARLILAAWERDRGGEHIYGTERVLASQVRALLAILDQVAPDEPAPSAPGTEG